MGSRLVNAPIFDSPIAAPNTLRERIQAITVIWTIVEAAASLAAARMARSPALLAFGGES
jgi:hypothetical protein